MFYLISLVVAVVLAGGAWFTAEHRGHAAGFNERDLSCKAEVADIRSHAEEVARQAQAEREKGRMLADQLAERLRVANIALQQSERRVRDEISRRTSAVRRALDAAATELLNAQTRGDIRESVSPAGPAAPGTVESGVRPVAADSSGSSGGTSERALATWISGAITQYNACAETVRAWRAWAQAVTK